MAITQVGVATLSDELLQYIKEQIKNGTLSFTDLIDGPDYAGQDGKFLQAFSGSGTNGMQWQDLPAAGLNWQAEDTDFLADDKIGILASNGITITLPSNPSEGTLVAVADHNSEFDVNPVTILASGGHLIEEDPDLVLDLRNAYVQLIFDGTKWEIAQVNHPFNIQEITEESFPGGQISYTLSRVPPSRSSILVTTGGKVIPTAQYSLVGNVLSFGAVSPDIIQVRHIGLPSAVKVSDTPVGAMLYFPNTEPVDGWLDCTGASISSNVYPDLVAYLTKNPNAEIAYLPDARGNFIRTFDHGNGTDVIAPHSISNILKDNKWGRWIDTLNTATAENLWDGSTATRTTVQYSQGYVGYRFDAPVSMAEMILNCNDAVGTQHLPDTIQAKASTDGVTWVNASSIVNGGASLQGRNTTVPVTLSGEYRFWAIFGVGGRPYADGSGEYWGVTNLYMNGSSTNRIVGGFQEESTGAMTDPMLGGAVAGSGQVASGTGAVALVQGGTGTAAAGLETRPDNQAYVLRIKAFHYQSGELAPTEVTALRNEVSRLSTQVNDGTSYVSQDPPENPSENARWYDTTSGRTYIWFNDGDSYQWVDDSPQAASTNEESLNAAEILAVGSTKARALNERFADAVNVMDFGATGDGVADDTVAIQAALTFSATTGKRLIVSEKHAFSSTLSAVATAGVDIEFIGIGEFICTESSLDHGLWISGLPYTDPVAYWDVSARTNSISLSTDVRQYDREITLSSGHGLVKGDWIRIGSTDSHTPTRTQYRKGELHQIQEVNGNLISLDSSTFDSYAASTTKVFKLIMPSVRLTNLKVTGLDTGNDTRGVVLWECADVTIDSPNINGFNDNGLDISFCVDVNVNKPTINFSSKSYSGSSRTSYGLVIGSSQSVNVIGGTLKGGRHSFAMGGYDPNRFIKVDGVTIMSNDVDDLNVAAMDSHENLVGLDVVNCTIYGGVNLAGQDINFSGNRVVISGEVLRAVEFRPALSCNYIIADNNNVFGNNGVSGGIVIRHYAADVAIRKVSTSGNIVVMDTTYARPGIGFEAVNPTNAKVELWECNNNQVSITSTHAGSTCITTWDSSDLADNPVISVTSIKGNYLVNKSGECIDVRHPSAVGRVGDIYIVDNTMVSQGDTGTFTILYFDKAVVRGCTFRSSAAALSNGKYNQFNSVNHVDIQDCIIENSNYNGARLRRQSVANVVNVTRTNCVSTTINEDLASDTQYTSNVWVKADGSGNIQASSNCTVSYVSTGRYYVIFTDKHRIVDTYPIVATPGLADTFVSTRSVDPTRFEVRTYDSTGTDVDSAFSAMIL